MVDRLEQLTQALADRYAIEREIGAGGMATVYLAQDLKHDRRVAIKVLRPELTAAVGADRFLREIRTTANLSHPHILPLFDSGEADGFLYFVMPYVKGESLRDRLRREKQLAVEEALQITREIADALAHAHGEGVIHRDVKPANVMLEAGHALLADFGIAQAMASVEETRLTESGMSLGTPSYMSPEQVSGEEELDGRSDQYALACVLYEMLAGHPPFSGAAGAVLRQHLAVDPQPVDRVRTSVPVEVSEAIGRGLAKSPADRFPTMEAFGEALAGRGRTAWTPSSLGRARAVIFGGTFVLALAVAATVASLWPRGNTNVDPNLVAVTPFENRTGDPSLDYVGDYAAEMVRHAIEGGFIAEVLPMTVAERVLDSAGEGADAVTALAQVVGVGTVVTGSVYRMGDSLRIGADCIDTRRGRSLFAVPPVSGTVDDLEEVVQRIQERVSGGLGQSLDQEFGWAEAERPPANPEAYREYRRGLDVIGRGGGFNEALPFLLRASEMDSTYMAPRLEAYAYFTNLGRVGEADSMAAILDQSRHLMTPSQERYLDWMRFSRAGEYERALQEARAGGEIAPVLWAYSIGFLAVRCNRLEESVRAFERWEKGDGEYREEFIATWGWPYFQWYATALHLLGRDEKGLEIALEGRRRFPEREVFEQLELLARIGLGQLQFADSIVEVAREEGDFFTLWRIANELSVHGFPDAARRIWEEEAERFESDPWYVDTATSAPRPGARAAVLRMLGRNEEAHALSEKALAANPDLPGFLGWVGLTAALTGDSAQAREVERRFAGMADPPPNGTLWQVWIAAALGEKERAVQLLRQAEGEGRVTGGGFRFGDLDIHREPAYQPLRGYPAFEEFVRPKG